MEEKIATPEALPVFDNKLGLFVHWGIYALTGVQEQAFARLDMPREEYEALATRFNPVHFDPDDIVLLAKKAGMKYICFTTKHHDGFCMWDTKYTDYNIMNTPYGKDVLKLLADACHRHGMLLSLYYSNPDWHHPKGYNPASTHQWKAVNQNQPDTVAYRQYIKDQITELLTDYGDIYTLFWDIPPKLEDPSINELARRLQPGILINDRGFSAGDFSTPEREYKSNAAMCHNRFVRMTEACNAVGEQSWGWRQGEDYHTLRYLTASIDRIMAMGGSYLLNIGPMADGAIDPDQRKIIERVGEWYRRVEGCLEGSEPDTFDYQVKANTFLATKKNGKTYLHFPEGLVSSAVNVKFYPGTPRRVRLLNTGAELPFAVTPLPEYFAANGIAERKYLHIGGIPADDLGEAVVLEIEW